MINLRKGFTWLVVLLGVSAMSASAQQRYSQRQTQKLNTLSRSYLKKSQNRRAQAYQRAKRLGIATRIISKGKIMELQRFTANGIPLYNVSYNATAAETISTDRVHNELGITGNGMTLGIWDGGGVRTTHREFMSNGSSRVTQRDAAPELNFHATHVAGTMVAAGVTANARGMAYEANLDAYDWNDDLAEMTAAAANGLLLSNHSYGKGTGWEWNDQYRVWLWFGDVSISTVEDYRFGFYDEEARDLDNIAVNAPNYLICKAAGNDRNNNHVGEHYYFNNEGNAVRSTARRNPDGNYDCIGGAATAKNILTVGAVNDIAGGYTRAADVVQSAFSSWGPTDDGRVKPDIVANGVNLNSTWHTADNAYNSISGTSMATPSVTGSLGLLQQYYHGRNNNTYMRSATLKALVIHTADEAGAADGPDYQNGWGLMNTKTAADVITNRNNTSRIEEQTLNNNGNYTIDVTATGNTPLVATIVWTDVAGTPVAPALDPANRMLVNDLDIRITHRNATTGAVTTHQPWILDPANPANAATRGDNDRDNVEKIYIANPVAGTYTITVTHKGNLHNNNAQTFSMIVTGINVNNNVACAVPAALNTSNVANTSAVLNWGAVAGASSYDVRYRAQGTTNWTNVNGVNGTSTNVNGLTQATTYEFQVRTNCAGGSSAYAGTVSFATTGAPTGYCDAQGGTADEYINRVQLGTLNNVSGDNNGYGDFTSQSVTLSRGSSTTITITPAWKGSTYREGYSVWIDFNRDGDFNDAGEQVYTRNATSLSSVSGSISIPSSAALGQTRMRVAMRYDEVPSACGTFRWGEVEDYIVNISSANSNNAAIAQTIQKAEVPTTDIALSPNPAVSALNISVTTEGSATFTLMGRNGAALQTQSAKAQGGIIKQTFDVSKYPAGLYLMKISANGTQYVKRVVVIK